ncbi:MAG: hypothetical protein QXW35_05760, partial [Candidatus Aenigmatarchaeota archaeon]
MQDREIARSITEIFLASKIIKAIENSIARKESMIIDVDLVSLEDYLFEDENLQSNSVNRSIFENIKIVDSQGRILNLSGSLFITEAEVLTMANGVTVRAPSINVENTNEVASAFVSMPASVDIVGTLSDVKDITIEKVGNTFNVVNTQTQEVIATVKTTVVPAFKEFAASIAIAVKEMFGAIAQEPLPFVIGLLGGAIVFPILKKVFGLFRRNKNKDTSEESYFIDKLDDSIVFEEKIGDRLRRLFDRIMTFLKTIYKKATTLIKAAVGFLVGVFRNAKDVAQRSLYAIRKLYIINSYKFTQYVLYVVEVIVKYVKLTIAKVKNIAKTTYTAIVKKAKEITRALDNAAQKAIQKIKSIIRGEEEDPDLRRYLDAISADLEKLRKNIAIVCANCDKGKDAKEVEKALEEITKTTEQLAEHIVALLVAFFRKLKYKAKQTIQRLVDKAVKIVQTIGDLFYSFVKALGNLAKKLKAKIVAWFDRIKKEISD